MPHFCATDPADICTRSCGRVWNVRRHDDDRLIVSAWLLLQQLQAGYPRRVDVEDQHVNQGLLEGRTRRRSLVRHRGAPAVDVVQELVQEDRPWRVTEVG